MIDLSIREVVQVLGLNYPIHLNSVNVVCPNCGHTNKRRKTMNIDFNINVWNCPKCSLGGGVLDFWAYHRNIDAPSKKEKWSMASKDIKTFTDGTPKVQKTKLEIPMAVDIPCAPLKIRDATYSEFLDTLELYNSHKENLMARGLSEEQIKANGYKSYPTTGGKEICHSLIEKGCILNGVPGFYKSKTLNKEEWTLVSMKSGIMIPVRTGKGVIQGMQVRLDNCNEGTRYLTWSSKDLYKGCRGKAFVHCNLGTKESFSEVILTEGPLKADIVSYFTGLPTLGVSGVNSIKHLNEYLNAFKNKGVRTILIAYDMDLYTNEHVAKALKNLKEMLFAYGMSCKILKWDKQFKGLDDYLNAKQ